MRDSDMLKHAACAAPSNSSGLVPALPYRLAKPYGWAAKAPLCADIDPRPPLLSPVQWAEPVLNIFIFSPF
jgi:hypothetical protein